MKYPLLLTLIFSLLAACGETPTAGAPNAPTAPPVDNEICRRVVEAHARNFTGGGRGWTFAGVDYPQPLYMRRLRDVETERSSYRSEARAEEMRPPAEHRNLVAYSDRQPTFRLDLQFRQPYAALPLGHTARLGEEFSLTVVDVVHIYIDKFYMGRIPIRHSRVAGSLTLTVERNPITLPGREPSPAFLFNGVVCELDGLWAVAFHDLLLVH